MPSAPTTESSPSAGDPVGAAERLLAVVAVLAAIGTVLALLLVQRLGTTYRDGLEVTVDGAEVAALGAASAESLAADLVELADSATASLAEARALMEIASDTTADLGAALGTNIADGISGTSGVADRLAGFIETIERFIPGDSDSLAEDLRLLSDGLEPVPDQLRSLAVQLEDSSIELDAAAVSLDSITVQIDTLVSSIGDARRALAEAQTLADSVTVRSREALDRSSTDLWLVRLLVVVIGLGVVGASLAGHRAVGLLGAGRSSGAGDGTRTHTPSGTGT